MLDEVAISCPGCGESITLLIDLSVMDQKYIEDCQVCCQPMCVHACSNGEKLVAIDVARQDD
jgi:hypothetical protein